MFFLINTNQEIDSYHTILGQIVGEFGESGEVLADNVYKWLDDKVLKSNGDLRLERFIAVHVWRRGQIVELFEVTLEEKLFDDGI